MAVITYSNPLSKGWDQMKKMLFRPFDLSKWFILGFTAFLADLLNGPHGNGGSSWKDHGHSLDWSVVADFPEKAWHWLMENIFWFSLIIFGILLITVIVVLFNWLSSRGKFMFLDNVVHNRAEVRKPWADFKQEGNSLFLWRLVYGIICFVLFLLILGIFFNMFLTIYAAHFPKVATVQTVIGMSLIFLLFIIVTGYVNLFLNDFVVPIMYKNKVGAMKAWGTFLRLLGGHFWYFVVYGIFIFILMIAVVLGVIAFTLLTCCIGGLLLVIPYLGSVILLPVSVTFRAFSVAFLEQFGPDYKFFPELNEGDDSEK